MRAVPNGMNFVHSSTVIGQFAPVSPLTEATGSPIVPFNETQATLLRTEGFQFEQPSSPKDMILNTAVAANLRNGWATGRSRTGLSWPGAEEVGIDTRLSYLISITDNGKGKPLQLECLVAIRKGQFCWSWSCEKIITRHFWIFQEGNGRGYGNYLSCEGNLVLLVK